MVVESSWWYHWIEQPSFYQAQLPGHVRHATRDGHVTRNLVISSKMLKIVIFKVYLLRHLWTEVGFDYGLWIYRTISKIHRAGFFNFAFVFEIFDLELCERRYFVQTSNGCYSVTESRRVNLMVSIDRVANGLSQSINKSRVPRTTWPGTLSNRYRMSKSSLFKVYLLCHLWAGVGFDYGLWIYGTIS